MTLCPFCRIAEGSLPARVVHEDELVVAFRDLAPQAPVHILVIPRVHVSGLAALDEAHGPAVARCLLVARRLAEAEGVAADGYRVVVNSGSHGGQSVHHLHFHVLGGRPFGWPPG